MPKHPFGPRLTRRDLLRGAAGLVALPAAARSLGAASLAAPASSVTSSAIHFDYTALPFRLESDEDMAHPHAPSTMAGGVAVFDYNNDGRPDIYFANGAALATLKKSHPRYRNCLLRNEGNGKFRDVTAEAGLAGTGFDNAVAVGDYDNDGHPDLFVAGLHQNTLYHNNGDGTFTDVTVKAGLANCNDPQYGPLWATAAAWVDVNNDGLLDLFVVNYLQWNFATEPTCGFSGKFDYCSPNFYKGQPCRLYLNKGNGTFEDVSEAWGIRQHVAKGMGVGVADFDLDGRPDLFVTNDTAFNFLFHNTGSGFKEVAFEEGVALTEDGNFISGMGLDFRDVNNDGYPDIFFVALNYQSFPLFLNRGGKGFQDATASSGLRTLTNSMAGYGAGIYDFDNDGWKDIFVTRGHVEALSKPGTEIRQHNTVFRNTGRSGKWQALTGEAGFTAGPRARHRGLAFGDFDNDGRIDAVATAIGGNAELWMNRSQGGNWISFKLQGTKSNRDGIGAVVKLQTKAGLQWNHMTSSVGYASSSLGPVHFGLGEESKVESVEIRWPSGKVQTLRGLRAGSVITVREPER